MPDGLIEHHHRMLVVGKRGGEVVEEELHGLGVGVRQYEREGSVPEARRRHDVGAGLHGREDVGEREAPVGEARRPFAAPPLAGR